MDKEVKKFWDNEFGDSEVGHDFTGKEVRKSSYGDEKSKFGWNIDHILPISKGGTDHYYNLQITHITTNNERGNRPVFWLDGTLYQIKRNSKICNEDVIADYDFDGKKYCITILQTDMVEQYVYDPWYDDDLY